MSPTPPVRLRLGVFELDLRAGELREGGRTVRLQEQCLRVLQMLIDRGGDLVSREELQKKLWPNDTVVDFGHSINSAIKKLRKALGDSAEQPQYIETVARRGYRLLKPVETAAGHDSARILDAPLPAQPTEDYPWVCKAGQKILHYRVIEVIGGGGMGMVYKAEDLRLGRLVALKFLPPELVSDATALHRFEREARTASSLDHPNICTIYSVEEQVKQPFLIMQLLDGVTLRDRLASLIPGRGLPLDQLFDFALQIADGLQAAHAKGIVHRDIKPANLFITRDGRLKILDFGLAKLMAPAESADIETKGDGVGASHSPPTSSRPSKRRSTRHPADATLTGVGMAMGTAGYMSPEQVRGEKLDARTDLFSLGLVLYEMAAGRRAFRGNTAAVLRNAVLHRAVPPLRELNPALPEELEHVINKLLEKDRQMRYQTISQTRAHLLRAAEELRSPKTPAQFLRAGKAIDSIAVLPFENDTADSSMEYLTDGITENIINTLSELPKLRVMARSTVFSYKGGSKSPQQVGRELHVAAVLTGRVRQRQELLMIATELADVANGSRLWGEQYSRKLEDVFSLEQEMARKISARLRANLTLEEKKNLTRRHQPNAAAYQEYLRGRYFWNQRTAAGVQKAMEYFSRAIQADSNYPLAYVGLADSYNILGFYGFAAPVEVFPKAKAAALQALTLDNTVAEARASLAYVSLFYDWDWAAAGKDLKRVVKLRPAYPTGRQFYAHYLAVMGRFEDSLVQLRKALELDPLSFIINAAIGWTLYFSRKYDEAIEQFHKTLEIDPHFVLAHALLGQAYLQRGMFPEAIAELRTAHDTSGSQSYYQAMLGHGLAVAGDAQAAQTMVRQLEEKQAGAYVSAYSVAEVYLGLGDKDATFAWLEKAHAERSRPLVLLNIEPKFDWLRPDPRFQSLLRRLDF